MKYGSVYLKKEGKDYKKKMAKYIQGQAKEQGWVKIEDRYLYMDEIIYSNRKDRDADNFKKLQQDSITESGVVWQDDSWCLPRTQRILIDKNNPRIELIITICDFIGVFDNDEQLKLFQDKCNNCRRYKNNCSILRNAILGRVQPEITNHTCNTFKKISD